MTETVEICDVAPRDGFQVVKTWIPTETKIAVVEALIDAGLKRIETGAFVSPKHVPQMSDTDEVHQKAKVPSDVRLSALVPNLRGAMDALANGVTDIVYVYSVSESHNKSNVRRPVAASIAELGDLIEQSKGVEGFKLRVNLATVFDGPFEGRVAEDDVMRGMEQVVGFGVPLEFGLCDTTGRAIPDHVAGVCEAAIKRFGSDDVGWAYHWS